MRRRPPSVLGVFSLARPHRAGFFAILALGCGDADPGASGGGAAATTSTNVAATTTQVASVTTASTASTTTATTTATTAGGGAPGCRQASACGENGQGSWSLDTPCDVPAPEQVPLYCPDGNCLTNAIACETSYIEVRRSLVSAHVDIDGAAFTWSFLSETQGELHIVSGCAAALGASSLADTCTPAELGSILAPVADACAIVGAECVCSRADTTTWTEEGTFAPSETSIVTTSNLGTYEVPFCAADARLLVDVVHAPFVPRRVLLARDP